MIVVLRGNNVDVEWRFGFAEESIAITSGRFFVYSGIHEVESSYEVRENVLYATIVGNQLRNGVYSMVFVYVSEGKNHVRKVSKAFEVTDDEKSVVEGVVVCDTTAYGRTLHSLMDVSSDRDGEAVEGASEGNVLTFQNGIWKGVAANRVDLTGYYTAQEINNLLKGKANAEDVITDYTKLRNLPTLADFMGSYPIGGGATTTNFDAMFWNGEDWQTRTIYNWALSKEKPIYTTDEVAEGSKHYYFTDDRAIHALQSITDAIHEEIRKIKSITDYLYVEDNVLMSILDFGSRKSIATKGLGTSSSGSGGGSYDRLDTWPTEWENKYNAYVLGASLGWELKQRVDDLEAEEDTLGALANMAENVDEVSSKAMLLVKEENSDKWIAKPMSDVVSNGDKNYIYSQASPIKTWKINHQLQKYPSVMVLNTANEMVFCDVKYDSENMITLAFGEAEAGRAILN